MKNTKIEWTEPLVLIVDDTPMNIVALTAQLRSFPDLQLKYAKNAIESANDGL